MNEMIPINWDEKLSHIIKVIGVGGGGNNAVRNMYEKSIEGVDFIICNTDAQVLSRSPIPNKIQLGAKITDGLGTGCNPEIGRQAALESIETIKKVLEKNTKMIFIASGMGGGTGTGAAPVIAAEAKQMGILTVAIVTLPFKDEGEEPYKRAIDGLLNLRQNVDSLLIINNERLYDIYPDISIFEAFPKADDIVATAAKSIVEIITVEGYINVDFADVKRVMTNSDMALMGLGRASGPNRVKEAADQALNSPLLNNNDISGAKNILVNISSGLKNPLKTVELRELMLYLNNASGRGANFKRGVTKDESLDAENSDAEISVTIIATGFSMDSSFPDIEDDMQSKGRVVHDPDEDYSSVPAQQDPRVIDLPLNPEVEKNETATPVVTGYVSEPAKVSQPSPSSSIPEESVFDPSAMNESDITEFEQTPAFLRQKKNTVPEKAAPREVSRFRLDESDGNHILSENNSYLDRDVD
jgi:cell division protein FtsZ